jgi:hypothetical protein
MTSQTVNAIERIRALVNEMKNEGTDPLFIYAALHQVIADLQAEAEDYGRMLADELKGKV